MKKPIEKIKPRIIDQGDGITTTVITTVESKLNEVIERVNELYDNKK